MRHVRMLGLCLMAALLVSAMAAIPAMAKYTDETWGQYKYCPYENPEVTQCVAGITSGGTSGGFFQIGKVEVPLVKPVTLQGGMIYKGAEHDFYGLAAAVNGGETLESPELPVRHGLTLISKEIQEEAHWPQALKESFKEAVRNKETRLVVKIEVAGNSIYESPTVLSAENLIEEEGAAFILPLKVRIISPWLAKLGGGPCQVGNDEHPVIQELTTADGGTPGHIKLNSAFDAAEVLGSRLVDFGWSVEAGADATGCGGSEYEQYVDEAIDLVSVNNASEHKGFTVLQGTLFLAEDFAVREAAKEGKV